MKSVAFEIYSLAAVSNSEIFRGTVWEEVIGRLALQQLFPYNLYIYKI